MDKIAIKEIIIKYENYLNYIITNKIKEKFIEIPNLIEEIKCYREYYENTNNNI